MALSVFKFSTKAAVVGGGVYLTAREGVWKSQNESKKALSQVKDNVIPASVEYYNKVPNYDRFQTKAVETWNSGVKVVFNGLSDSPSTMAKYSRMAYEKVASPSTDQEPTKTK